MAINRLVTKRLTELLHSENSGSIRDALQDIGGLPCDYQNAILDLDGVKILASQLNFESENLCVALETFSILAQNSDLHKMMLEEDCVSKILDLMSSNPSHNVALKQAVIKFLNAINLNDGICENILQSLGTDFPTDTLIEAIQNEDVDTYKLSCVLVQKLVALQSYKNYIGGNGCLHKIVDIMSDENLEIATHTLNMLASIVANSSDNQNILRDIDSAIDKVIKFLVIKKNSSCAAAATGCLSALCMENDSIKTILREKWVIPLLVNNLEKDDDDLLLNTVQCLRNLTAENNVNKLALCSIPSAILRLVQLIKKNSPLSSITEQTAAILGNLSSVEQFSVSIRESGGLQCLVMLLDAGPTAKVTEIAAKSLANMSLIEKTQKSIRLAGGLVPLINLLTQCPSVEVLNVVEEALQRLHVQDIEKNAVLESLRYCEQKQIILSDDKTFITNADCFSCHKPLAQYNCDEVAGLLSSIGINVSYEVIKYGIMGGDLLQFADGDLIEALKLTALQVEKFKNVKKAFDLFENIATLRGRGDLTLIEFKEWMLNKGYSHIKTGNIIDGVKLFFKSKDLTLISYAQFVRLYQWLTNALEDK